MNAIDILNRCRNAQNELRRLEERINRYRACATDTSAHINPNGRVQGSGGDSLSEFAAEISDCTAEYEKRQREYKAESYCACKLLDGLPEVECTVLYRFYLGGQTLHGIAVALSLTDGYVKSKKADGLRLISQIVSADVIALLPDWYGI
ncbi:MAG: hypothetical protein PHY12_05960 [Eubacteriales bacterium]|nr:hypothetical protein [Eubacteriales bacterium]